MGNKQNSIKRSKFRQRMKRRLILQKVAQQCRQKNILRKLNPPPKPEPGHEPEPEVKRALSLSQSVEVTGPRSCRLQKCAFNGCPNSAPSAAPHNDGVTYFAFPGKPGQDIKWARRVSRANGAPFWPRLTSRVCQLHFPPELVTTDRRGAAALARGAMPYAEPYEKEETSNTEEVLLPKGDTNEQCGTINCSEDLIDLTLEIDNHNPGMEQAVASVVDTLPLENGIKLQYVNVENENATVHHLNIDKDNTVNHTHVNINKNNIGTLHYVDIYTVNHTLKCSNLNEDQISSYEALVNPNITHTRVIVANQNDQEKYFGIKSNSKLVGGKNMTPDEETEETIQNTESYNLNTDIITVTSEDCNSDGKTEEIVIREADTSAGIQTCHNDFDEIIVITSSESESDSNNGMEHET